MPFSRWQELCGTGCPDTLCELGQGELRIAHCGGFHAAPFNVLVKAVNLVATLLGHPIHWDTETVSSNDIL